MRPDSRMSRPWRVDHGAAYLPNVGWAFLPASHPMSARPGMGRRSRRFWPSTQIIQSRRVKAVADTSPGCFPGWNRSRYAAPQECSRSPTAARSTSFTEWRWHSRSMEATRFSGARTRPCLVSKSNIQRLDQSRSPRRSTRDSRRMITAEHLVDRMKITRPPIHPGIIVAEDIIARPA